MGDQVFEVLGPKREVEVKKRTRELQKDIQVEKAPRVALVTSL
jgi:hypothetical protein